MENKKFLAVFAFSIAGIYVASAITVDSDFVTFYPGEEEKISVEIDNNEKFDVEDVSFRLVLDNLAFTSVGSSERSIDEIDEDDEEDIEFTIRPSTEIVPGDYNIPYEVTYVEKGDENKIKKTGTIGVRVSAKTELKYSVYPSEDPIVGSRGQITLEIINEGLGEIKSIYVEIQPEGYELLSKNKVFVGSVEADDTDIINFEVLYQDTNPVLKAEVTYKDFDNNEKLEKIALPFKVYTIEEAKQLGIVNQSKVGLYVGIAVIIIIVWFVFRYIRRRKRKNNKKNVTE